MSLKDFQNHLRQQRAQVKTRRAESRQAGGSAYVSPFEVARKEARRRASTGDWEGAKGAAMVGLYAVCHELTYKTVPVELEDQAAFRGACRAAATMLHSHFDDRPELMVEFVKWCWEQETGKDRWARTKGINRNRMGWRLQFSASKVTDWRAARARGR